MPNSLAYLMLILWPVIVAGLFSRLPLQRALIWSILGAYLLLPPVAAFSLPLFPDLDKSLIAGLAAFVACTVMLHQPVPLLPQNPAARCMMLIFLLCPVATVLTNDQPLEVGHATLPGLLPTEILSSGFNQLFLVLPFVLGRRFLAGETAQRDIMVALMTGGLIYSLPMMLEVRLSPQINVWVYGFFQHSFEQMIRFGGFRPIVFLPHGLWAAFFAMIAVVATLALWKPAQGIARKWYFWTMLWLSGVLVLCKTFGPVIYALVLIPCILLLGRRLQIVVAAGLALCVLIYPTMREADLVPVHQMIAQVEKVNVERALSLEFRFTNEDLLIEHAKESPLFGWGGWGRNMVYDPETGRPVSVSDGRWIILLSTFGWFGYIGEFCLLILPLCLLAWEVRRMPSDRIPPLAGPLALLHAANLVDLLPNATLVPLTWLLAGALLGQAEILRVRNRAEAEDLLRARRVKLGLQPDPVGPRTIL